MNTCEVFCVQERHEIIFMKGALERVLIQCATYLGGKSEGVNALPLTSSIKERFVEQARLMGSTGLRGLF